MEKTISQTIKIAIIGPESSGKSTLTKQLATKYCGRYVEEFARQYLEESNGKYVKNDLDYFAKKQLELEFLLNEEKLIFCDTTPLSIRVWSLYKYGDCSSKIDNIIDQSSYDFQLLLKPDLPYEEDPLREDSPLKNRIELFHLFESELIKTNQSYSIIEGRNSLRLNNAVKTLNSKISF